MEVKLLVPLGFNIQLKTGGKACRFSGKNASDVHASSSSIGWILDCSHAPVWEPS